MFARYLARPLRQLNEAVARVGEGGSPPPLPEAGPSEIVNLNRGFNRMLANLQQAEMTARCCSPACRTICARRWRACAWASKWACVTTPSAMPWSTDIEEMDKIIGQFLDFARGD